MPTNLHPHYEEKRSSARTALRLPIVVSGFIENGATWSEPTETVDISANSALFHLNQKVKEGESLYIRSYLPNGVPVEVKAKVMRVAPAIYDSARIGVAVTELTDDWLRLFVEWLADDPSEENETF